MTLASWSVSLFAMTKEERLILWVGILTGTIVVGGVILSRIDRWRKRQMADIDESVSHSMSFRALYDRGEISKEEYDRVMKRMAEKLGAKPKLSAASAAVLPQDEPPANEDPPSTPS